MNRKSLPRKSKKNTAFDSTIFLAYDIRGIYPEQINPEIVYKIAQAYAKFLNPKTIALGRDVRLSGPELLAAVKQGLLDHGVDVIDIGVVSTEMLYFAVADLGLDGGITISASHNVMEYNGLKITRENALPISVNSGLEDIKRIVLDNYNYNSDVKGMETSKDITKDYLEKCLSFVDISKIKKLKVVANAMFGLALQNIKKINLPIELILLNDIPDGHFPKGQPNPLLPEQQIEIIETIKATRPDFGVAWDGDGDRFFIFDEKGRFIPPYYVLAFLTRYFCSKFSNAKVVHDLRLAWAIEDEARAVGAKTIQSKAGYPYVRKLMRDNEALIGCETSGHMFFKDFFYTDNGLIPFLIMLEIVSELGEKTSKLFDKYFENYPISGEINIKIMGHNQVQLILERLEQHFVQNSDISVNKIDGISFEHPKWRANIRGSNTEPFVRMNVEAKTQEILKQKTEELLELIRK
ncbi:hypothetical protein A2641_00845 [Candidatus Nomurabacteria bacterium RIFCSPHIGHO2_01_FULL_37_25]|nr:MAG: hypothetical protein A2641_00845 [Candidatus Nomurabacteria bacterium RIFCSPHIGHO2_01_FULL_37_25]OGI74942.1 MAG: hypothetical protein A3D36_01450 [Candidatus Nomurabacteria bacterium RIFCSPHIGHO2_02_FULL_36_29]